MDATKTRSSPGPMDTVRTLARLFRLCFAAVILAGGAATPAYAQGGWDVSKIDGRDYVTVENIKRFYAFDKLVRSGNHITLVNRKYEMKLRIGSHECLMNNVKFVFSEPVVAKGANAMVSRLDLAKLIDPVLRPNYIPTAGNFRTVIIDAGHGGKDPGATNALGTEAGYNLKVAGILKGMLENAGYKVVMTRQSDRYLSLQQRVDLANAVREPAIFISIHFNAGGRNARGIETFTLSPPGVSHYGRGLVAGDMQARAGNQHDSANIALATAVHGYVLRGVNEGLKKGGGATCFDRGIKRARFSVLSGVRHPAILFEGGFMSHPYEARLIHNESYQRTIAKGIVDAIKVYRSAVTMKPAGVQP